VYVSTDVSQNPPQGAVGSVDTSSAMPCVGNAAVQVPQATLVSIPPVNSVTAPTERAADVTDSPLRTSPAAGGAAGGTVEADRATIVSVIAPAAGGVRGDTVDAESATVVSPAIATETPAASAAGGPARMTRQQKEEEEASLKLVMQLSMQGGKNERRSCNKKKVRSMRVCACALQMQDTRNK